MINEPSALCSNVCDHRTRRTQINVKSIQQSPSFDTWLLVHVLCADSGNPLLVTSEPLVRTEKLRHFLCACDVAVPGTTVNCYQCRQAVAHQATVVTTQAHWTMGSPARLSVATIMTYVLMSYQALETADMQI